MSNDLVQQGVDVVVQPSERRIFPDDAYRAAGAVVSEDLSRCRVIFGVKEMPASVFEPGTAYVFFSHTIKGQPENMAMLKALMDRGCQLIDYEPVRDDEGRRLIFFGWYAGVAGMVESLAAFGARAEMDGTPNPFAQLRQPYHYDTVEDMRSHLREVAAIMRSDGVPPAMRPLVIGVTGYGNVSQGAQDMLDQLPVTEVSPQTIPELGPDSDGAAHTIYKAVFKESDLVRPRQASATFDLQHYYDHPQAYESVIEDYLPHMSMLVNCMYWDARYPRLVTREFLKQSWAGSRLSVIGDIGCDIDGAVEVTHKATEPGEPCYVYEPASDRFIGGIEGDGPVIMAVDILPAELPRDSSNHFSEVLLPFVREIAQADFSAPLKTLALPAPVKRALILHNGVLAPDYQYISKHL